MSNDQDSNTDIYEHNPPQKHAGTPNIPHIIDIMLKREKNKVHFFCVIEI